MVFERILLLIFLQHAHINSRGKSPRSAARMSEDAIFCIILTIVYESCRLKLSVFPATKTCDSIPGEACNGGHSVEIEAGVHYSRFIDGNLVIREKRVSQLLQRHIRLDMQVLELFCVYR